MTGKIARCLWSVPLFLALSSLTLAQPGTGPGGSPGGPAPDRDRQQARKRDGSGPGRPTGPAAGPASKRLDQMFDAMDADGDGKIDRAELARKGPEVLKRLQSARAGQSGPLGPRGLDFSRGKPAADRPALGPGRGGGDDSAVRGTSVRGACRCCPWGWGAGRGRGMGPGKARGMRDGWDRPSRRGMGPGMGRGSRDLSDGPAGPGMGPRMGGGMAKRGLNRNACQTWDRLGPGPRFGRGGTCPFVGRGPGQGRGWQDRDRWDGDRRDDGDSRAFCPPGRRGGFDGPRWPRGRNW